ncbi:MAG: cytidine deaminase [Anaerolineae bacterium]|nr:cytidine deaminase [Anaerolineae bacterium]NUQ06513.1 cytidine deaminase [Anaerolineae bacterium]
MTDPNLVPLIRRAREASTHAYIPYSGYRVGALLRAADGTLFAGCNVENAAYPATICAERTALVKAVSEGYRTFDLLIVYTPNGGSPCGICRQMLYEFAPDLRVLLVDDREAIVYDGALTDLLPRGFGPASLPDNRSQGEDGARTVDTVDSTKKRRGNGRR